MKATKTTMTVLLVLLGGSGPSLAERRPPMGSDAGLLESQVRSEVERKIAPALSELAPGQAELKYVDVRVSRPTALPTGVAPGFEDLGPAADYVAERVEVSLLLDAKLPADFRKNLKNLLKNRIEGLGVPVDFKDTIMPFPAPRPQPQAREPLPYYPPPPPAPTPQASPVASPPPAPLPERGLDAYAVLAAIAVVLLALASAALLFLALDRRRRKADAKPEVAAAAATKPVASTGTGTPAVDRLPEVRRGLLEDRVLARRVLGEMLRQEAYDKVARTVELVGPSVVEDLRSDPGYALALREAASRLAEAKPLDAGETRQLADELHRRILKHRMMGAEDPVEQEFAFLVGLPAERFAAVLAGERPAAQAAALRYAPAHLRAGYLSALPAEERVALVAALGDGKAVNREYLLDVATTLRARAIDQAHVGTGEANDLDLLIEMLEDRDPGEQHDLLDTLRRVDGGKWRRVQAALVTDDALAMVDADVLGAAALAVPHDALATFLRAAPDTVVDRALGALPGPVAAGLREELALEIPTTADRALEARRLVNRAVRRALRDRGLAMPAPPPQNGERGRVVAL